MAEASPEELVAPTSPTRASPAETVNSSHAASAGYPLFEIPSTLPCPPFVDVGGVANFRELGGYLCSPYGGSMPTHIVRRSVFYRCAHPTQITPAGCNTLSQKLGVKAIYDLRSAPEVARTNAAAQAAVGGNSTNADPINPLTIANAPTTIAGVTRHFTPVYTAEDYSPEALARKLQWYKAANSAAPTGVSGIGPYSEGFLQAYRDISNHGVGAYTTIFKHILDTPSDPFAFHCTAGKDRTGIFGAMIMRLARVDDETICWEYAITEPGLGSWRDMFIERMTTSEAGGSADSAAQATTPAGRKIEPITREEASRIAGSRGGNMRAYLKLVLDGELGGVERYLTEKCGFTADEVEQIRANIVVPLTEAGEGSVIKPTSIAGWTVDGGVQDDSSGALPLDINAGTEKEQKVMMG